MKEPNSTKQHYQQLRVLSCTEIWDQHVAAFDRADARERTRTVAVVRAVGVIFSESGTPAQKAEARQWLVQLLDDPEEKIRRYATNALPKLDSASSEETALTDALRRSTSDREKTILARALGKIGSSATLEMAEALGSAAQKVRANVARSQPSRVLLDRVMKDPSGVRIRLGCRAGLERIVEDELHEQSLLGARFHRVQSTRSAVTIAPAGRLSLADLYALRCFSFASFVLGTLSPAEESRESLARLITSPLTRRIFAAFTDGPIRYRLEFVSKGHQRAAVREVAQRVHELCPELINDSREAPWQIDIIHHLKSVSVELAPRLRPDPRFAYRRRDIPAASHPPLAACLARLAGTMHDEVVWDPFCGSGLELVETALRGPVRHVIGTDLRAEAVAIAEENFAAAIHEPPGTTFAATDFRDWRTIDALRPGSVSLVITNPPLGRRVPIPDLRSLIEDLFETAAAVLQPGGRLVFVNPLPVKPADRALDRLFRQKVDLGGFHCHIEKYQKC